ncbi:hypothetical protein HanIR_Chr12g0564631 [Helianthus annuus]|nr:hypothetical protein HanIR_Chr12g0564631 [Helianthus annuus]
MPERMNEVSKIMRLQKWLIYCTGLGSETIQPVVAGGSTGITSWFELVFRTLLFRKYPGCVGH